MRQAPKGLAERISVSLDLYPCEVLFVHRDAEGEIHGFRVQEINKALNQIAHKGHFVHLVPVRMTEAWLLIDERIICQAAGRPDGKQRLSMPRLKTLENCPIQNKLCLICYGRQASEQGVAEISSSHTRLLTVFQN